MEEDQDFSLYGKAVVTEANLRDDNFRKLLADFFGSQTGEGLGFDEAPCKNKLLIQVGLMKEENNLSWVAVIEWLQKVFPTHQSADFRCLIERGIATTLSLGNSSRLSFLELDVNFNFVGPICDSIGVERTDLLDMRDFSEQAKSIEVTNGLILELSNFVTREKIDSVILVTWLRNFNPEFCKDGDIHKASKILKSKIKKFKLYYRNYETRSHRRNIAMENLLQSPFELVPNKAGRKLGMKKRLRRDTEQDAVKVKEEEESFAITMDEEKLWPCLDPRNDTVVAVKGENDNSRDEGDNSNEGEETPDDKGEALTLIDITMLSVQKLTSVYGGKTAASKQVSMDLLKNQYALTCKEHRTMLEFEAKMFEAKMALHSEDWSLASPLFFIHTNAHLLVDIHNAVEQLVMSFEKEIAQCHRGKLGRDGNPKFLRFVNFSESATSRYIHMACDVLSPRAPAKQNYRRHWVAFCEEMKNPSRLAVNLSNRCINYFEAAAGLIHHHKEIGLFFSDLLELSNNDCVNVVLESVTADAVDDVIQSFVCALAIVYCKILGPYWQLLKSGGEYSLFSHYILCLHQKLLEWSKDPSPLLEPEGIVNVFLQFPLQEQTFDRVFSYCGQPNTNRDLIRACLRKMVNVIAAITEENLMDFLPGGIYSKSPPSNICAQLASCTFSILMGEYPFGHADPDKKKRPNKSFKDSDHSSSGSSSEDDDDDLSGSEKSPRRLANKSPLTGQKGEQPSQSKKRPKNNKEKVGGVAHRHASSERMNSDYIRATVGKNGGPCKTQPDVDKLMVRFDGRSRADKREALRCEILYQKMVLGNTDPNLDHTAMKHSVMIAQLKLALPRVKPGFSLVLAPRRTKPKQGPTQTSNPPACDEGVGHDSESEFGQ